MDYILFSGLQGLNLHDHLNMYDIWCMYHKNLCQHNPQLPPALQFDFDSATLDRAIPKFHLNADGESCRTIYSLNFFPGVGHTDGEGIECNWASVNGAAQSTKEMGEGSQHDTLDDILGNMNYCKFIAMGKSNLEMCSMYLSWILFLGTLLQKKLKNAIIQCQKHDKQHGIFCGVIPDATRAEWMMMISQWENNKSKPDPYIVEKICVYLLC
jgi:Kyakuja-Dileera-Zisupton transposase